MNVQVSSGQGPVAALVNKVMKLGVP